MFLRSLAFRLALVVALALAVGLGVFLTFLVGRHEADLIEGKREEAELLTRVIKGGLEDQMIRGEPGYDMIQQSVQDMARRSEVPLEIRIYRKVLKEEGGKITHSSIPAEIGRTVDLKADACVQCHGDTSGPPLELRGPRERTRIYEANGPGGTGRYLGVIDPLYNDASCQKCHRNDPKIIGVLDVVMSLDRLDAKIADDARGMWIFGIVGALVLVAGVSILIHYLVHRPVKALVRGAEKVGRLDLDFQIPADRQDELGELSRAFNEMTSRLKTAREELRIFSDGLEEKVREKSRELENAQHQMVRAEKLAAVGHMAAGVAHEINNPLTGVITIAHLLKKKHPPDTPEGQDLDTIIEEARRCAGIVRGLLDFARERTLERRRVEPNRLLDRALSLVENQALFHNIEVQRDYEPDLPSIEVDPDRIEQVLLNLVLNAAEAMESGGRLTLLTRTAEGEQGFDRAVRIDVGDTGAGIPEEIRDRIFDPFFTTKETGKGTGLGLAVSYGIVDEHGGRIVVRSEVGVGTTFSVYLPLGEEPQP